MREVFVFNEIAIGVVAERLVARIGHVDVTWRCIIALARIGGVRVPSEIMPLTWADVDWDRERVRITSPETAHKGKGSRTIPLFPELAVVLREAFEMAVEGETFVVNRYRDPGANLRTHFRRIIKRAGLEPWSKLFHNCRASRAIDLAREYPVKACEKWMGHTAIAAKHYLTVTDDDWDRATSRPTLSATLSAANADDDESAPDGDNSRNEVSENLDSDAMMAGVSQNDSPGSGEEWAILDSKPCRVS